MSTVVRHLINDVDPTNYSFTTSRLETTILVAAQLLIMNVDFNNEYEINVEAVSYTHLTLPTILLV